MKQTLKWLPDITPQLKWFVILAIVFTALNALKPLCIDDTLYYINARQMAAEPLRPYGFEVFWNDRPEPAVQALAPPLFPYYWSIAIRLFGDNPLAWKLWLLPISLLLVFALRALFRRFSPGYELPFTCFVVLSPVFLPGFNLMLEVPVAALSLTALAIFFSASDRGSFLLAMFAGLVAGIAMQTKYSAFAVPVVVLVYALLFGKLRLGIAAVMVAAAFFAGFEAFIFYVSGHSHWLYQSQLYGSVNLLAKYFYLAWPLLTLTGSLTPMLGILALDSLGVGKRYIFGSIAAVFASFVLIAFAPESAVYLVFSLLGVFVIAALGFVIANLVKPPAVWRSWRKVIPERKPEIFLALWLAAEIVAYFALSPIPAARRMTFLLVVGTLIVGRLAVEYSRPTVLRAAVAVNVVLAALFYGVDMRDAFVEKWAAERSSAAMQQLDRSAGHWYTGRWGFQFYAERTGMKPVFPDRSELRPGDLVAVTDGEYWTKPLKDHLNRYDLEAISDVTIDDAFPLKTMIGFYNSGMPIHRRVGPLRVIRIFMVKGAAAGGGSGLVDNIFSRKQD